MIVFFLKKLDLRALLFESPQVDNRVIPKL